MSTDLYVPSNAMPLTLQFASVASLLLISNALVAAPVPVIAGVVSIDQSSPANDYALSKGATLNVNGGSQHGRLTATDSTLNISAGSTIASSSVRNGSEIRMSDAAVSDGLEVNNSTGTLSGSTIANSTGNGLILNRQQSLTTGSDVSLTDSSSSGALAGAFVTHFSQLELIGSQLAGTGINGVGLRLNAGAAQASASSIVGTVNGVAISSEAAYTDASLKLDSTQVVGQTGAAIRIGLQVSRLPGSTVAIDVNNGSSLTGGNSNMLEVTGTSAAVMNVSASSLNGNVQVESGSTVTLNLDNSSMAGDVLAEPGALADVLLDNNSVLTGRLENTRSVAINNGAQWAMIGNSALADLTMNGGAVRFGDAAGFYTLSVANLAGNGTFIMDVDFAAGRTDFLDITDSATGSHSLLIGSTGTDPSADTSLHVVRAAAGDADFSLMGGAVDLGAWSYDLVKQGPNDWYLDAQTRKVSPAAATVVALFNTAPTVWYGELTSLRTRMGELRHNGGRSGVWMRTYGNKLNVADASGFGYQQTQQGFSLGADGKVPMGDGQWLAGVMAGQSSSDLSLDRGASGKVGSYYVGAYSTWLDSDTGYYFDGVLKFNRFNNKARVNLSDGTRTKGDYSNSGVGASLEFGRHIKLDNGYFVEPYGQLAGVVVEGKDYELDNGMRAENDLARSLVGKLGATTGRNFDLGQGRTVQPYVRAAWAHEFAKNNGVQVNDNDFNNDLSGSRGELGIGVAASLSDRLQINADFEHSKGDRVEQPWGASVGIRYSW
ncbi:autotransporter outer membrane beta-barrel domain-containing protein [Pseudomonas syringae pv. tagetis]|uniref:Autotransporter barrel protein with pertacin-like passenger domain n=3 Tax=Pseudomonas TaxID=286 RepID=A0A0Q0C537_9PSED|nr:autotransporter outer membrane beta-barrel domain-containing protein [Pseudomonas syringae group genomosp. 7]KPX46275.1 Autotransporter [Pseudomonas syringae pv. helianthi]KPY86559.1 Autotransporter barrel protein with pertacin-like passenger domain [Pseudomonas syringae pv. tagetis]RMR01736.1 putative Autotransporter [Pseudomonas syringae pv. helianthi]RMW17155.1 putative Autotransporter [Pseudomonas syringae pv. tagetis]RMW23801.1 putative Autotransporter [Pseudomonas syringae pv. tagetis